VAVIKQSFWVDRFLTGFLEGRNFNIKFLLILFLLGFVNFSGSLHNPFLLDDSIHYLNEKKQNPKFILYNFIPDLLNKPGFEDYENNYGYYRPLTHSFYAAQAILFKEHRVYYELFCIIAFVLCCYSIYCFLFLVTANRFAAAVAALLYLLHPFNGLCVNYKTACIFSLQIILFNVIFIHVIKRFKEPRRVINPGIYPALLFLYVLTLLMHELAFVFPFFMVVFWLLNPKYVNKKSFWFLFGFVAIAACYFIFRSKFANINSSFLGAVFGYKISWLEFCSAYARIIRWVLVKLFYPTHIFIQSTTLIDKHMTQSWAWVFMFFVALAAYGAYFWQKRSNVYLFCWLIFLSGFIISIPGTYYGVKTGLLFFEPHWIFYTNIGLFALGGVVIERLRKANVMLALLLLGFLCLSLVYFSAQQNKLYNNLIRYFTVWSQETPGYELPVTGLCGALVANGNVDEAIVCNKTLLGSPRESMAQVNLAYIYFDKKDYPTSSKYFQALIDAKTSMSIAYEGLAAIAMRNDDYNKAVDLLEKARNYDKLSLGILLKEVDALLVLKKVERAAQILEKTVEYYPSDATIKLVEIKLLFQLNKQQEARSKAFELIHVSTDVAVLVKLTTLLLVNRAEDLAQVAYIKAFNINKVLTQDLTKETVANFGIINKK